MSFNHRNNLPALSLDNYTILGAVLVLVYCILSAAKEVMIGHHVQEISPNLLAFVSFGFVILIFNASALWRHQQFYAAWSSYRKSIPGLLHLNVETMLAWGCFFWAVKFLEPAVVSAVTVGLSSLFAQMFTPSETNNPNLTRKTLTSTGISLFLLITTYCGFSAMGHVSQQNLAIGALLCTLGAAAIARLTSRTRELYKRGYTAIDLMRARFFGLVGGSGTAVVLQGDAVVDLQLIVVSLLIAVFGIAAPIYSLQKGLERCSSTTTLLIIASAPGFTWLFQLTDPRLNYSTTTSFAIVALFLVAMWCIFGEEKARNDKRL